MTRRRRNALALLAVPAAAVAVAACGSQGIDEGVNRQSDSVKSGAKLFAENCGGCHTLAAAGTQGSTDAKRDVERTDGPNFDQRRETVGAVLYAIRNGGFSGAIMPQNIVVGQEAQDVAEFVAKYAGRSQTSPEGTSGFSSGDGAGGQDETGGG
jgi:mono/diheme cytochrome c family protein